MVLLGTVGDGLPHVVYHMGGQHPHRPSPEHPADEAPEHVHAATAPPHPLFSGGSGCPSSWSHDGGLADMPPIPIAGRGV